MLQPIEPNWSNLGLVTASKSFDFGPLALFTHCSALAAAILFDLGHNPVFVKHNMNQVGVMIFHRMQGEGFSITERQILDFAMLIQSGDMKAVNAWVEKEWNLTE